MPPVENSDNVGCGKDARAQLWTGIKCPPGALLDEEHKWIQFFNAHRRTRHGIVVGLDLG